MVNDKLFERIKLNLFMNKSIIAEQSAYMGVSKKPLNGDVAEKWTNC